MGAKHTPPPWVVANGVQIRSERHQIAKVWMMRNGEGNANARLIAAAPELLEALEEALNQLGTLQLDHKERWSNERTNMVSAARLKGHRAITKATHPQGSSYPPENEHGY